MYLNKSKPVIREANDNKNYKITIIKYTLIFNEGAALNLNFVLIHVTNISFRLFSSNSYVFCKCNRNFDGAHGL